MINGNLASDDAAIVKDIFLIGFFKLINDAQWSETQKIVEIWEHFNVIVLLLRMYSVCVL